MTGIDEAEADADEIMKLAGVFGEEPKHPRRIAKALGVRIESARGMRGAPHREGDLARVGNAWIIFIFERMSPEREAWIIGHELAHWLFRRRGSEPLNEEARCDAIGACLIAPRAAFAAATRVIGHRVHELASAFNTTQSLALLRIGEVTGRPVILLRRPPIARGDDFEWGEDPRALPHSVAHQIKVDRYWGMMAERYAA